MLLINKSVKIIKRKHRKPSEPREKVKSRLQTENQSRRELVKTVTSWIEQRKKAKKEFACPKACC